jgi:hypothetical protein
MHNLFSLQHHTHPGVRAQDTYIQTRREVDQQNNNWKKRQIERRYTREKKKSYTSPPPETRKGYNSITCIAEHKTLWQHQPSAQPLSTRSTQQPGNMHFATAATKNRADDEMTSMLVKDINL